MWFGRLLVDEVTERRTNPSVFVTLLQGFVTLLQLYPEADYEGRVFLGLWFRKESPQ